MIRDVEEMMQREGDSEEVQLSTSGNSLSQPIIGYCTRSHNKDVVRTHLANPIVDPGLDNYLSR